MIISLDNMAERYGLLPSEVLHRGSTFDLYVIDAALSYREYVQRKADGQIAQNYTADELAAMMYKPPRKTQQ